MATPKKKQSKRLPHHLVLKAGIAVIGLLLSLILHELFHIAMHWNHISSISLFPRLGTIVEISAQIPPDYDMEGEEIAAYAITLLVMIITTIIIFRINDADDRRSAGQILFPKDKSLQRLDPTRLLSALELDDAPRPATKPRQAPRRKRRS